MCTSDSEFAIYLASLFNCSRTEIEDLMAHRPASTHGVPAPHSLHNRLLPVGRMHPGTSFSSDTLSSVAIPARVPVAFRPTVPEIRRSQWWSTIAIGVHLKIYQKFVYLPYFFPHVWKSITMIPEFLDTRMQLHSLSYQVLASVRRTKHFTLITNDYLDRVFLEYTSV